MKGHDRNSNSPDQNPRPGPRLEQSPQQIMEFENAEEMLRFDSEQTPIPKTVAKRLNESLERIPKPPVAWWRRFFGK
jgi:hypothetical protein